MIRNFTRIIIKNNVRIYLSDYTDIVSQVISYHKYRPFPNLILANFVTTFSPLRFLYDSNDILVKLSSNGAVKSIILEIKNDNTRALISDPNIDTEYDQKGFNTIPLILGIGDGGNLEVSRKFQNEYFKSSTELYRFDIVSDLAYFLNKSDQIYSAIINDVKLLETDPNVVEKAKNVIFQLLPDHNEEDKIWVEEFVKKYKFNDYSISEYEELIGGKRLDIKQLGANCWCSKEKIISAVNLLAQSEIDDLFKKDDFIEGSCDFCNKRYQIHREDLI